MRRIGLVGCVKAKAASPRRAKDLYVSTLFSGRRSFVEQSCDEWWILSAKHGLVEPDEVLAPYDLTLKTASRADRRRWSSEVLVAIDERCTRGGDYTFEIHAGSEYRDFGLADGLMSRGFGVEVPTAGMRIGQQLQFYRQASQRRR